MNMPSTACATSVSGYGLGGSQNSADNWSSSRGTTGVVSVDTNQQNNALFGNFRQQEFDSWTAQNILRSLNERSIEKFKLQSIFVFVLMANNISLQVPSPGAIRFILIRQSFRYHKLQLFDWLEPFWQTMIYNTLFVVAASTVISARDRLPSCDQIPKLLCCTDRILDKCLPGCLAFVTDRCPQKLRDYDKIDDNGVPIQMQHQQVPQTTAPSTLPMIDGVPQLNPISVRRQTIKLSSVDFEPESKVIVPNSEPKTLHVLDHNVFKTQPQQSQTYPAQTISKVDTYRNRGGAGGDYAQLNSIYPLTQVSDSELPTDCGTETSHPPYSPCLSRKLVDELFLSCCQQHVPTNCHSLCTYEHREHVAAETLIQAIQQDICDLRYLSNILYCANRNRDNRNCCQFLGLAQPELSVGNRCLRMCNIAESGDRVGTLEKNDLVCLSNWNVIMYCARAGLRTIN